MTQFICVSGPLSRDDPEAFIRQVASVEGVSAKDAKNGWVWVVSAHDQSSPGPLVDELFNRIFNHEDIEDASLVRLLRKAASEGWIARFWYGSDASNLPCFTTIGGALEELVNQASVQPPEVHLYLAGDREVA